MSLSGVCIVSLEEEKDNCKQLICSTMYSVLNMWFATLNINISLLQHFEVFWRMQQSCIFNFCFRHLQYALECNSAYFILLI